MSKAKSRSLSDFRSLHDPNVVVPNKIRAALAALLAEGAENWEYEADFMKRAGINQTDIGRFREQFEKHVIEARERGRNARRIWFADPKVAAKARGE